VRLHEALEKAGVPNRLHTVAGGNHGGFTLEQNLEAAQVIRDFLHEHGVLARASAPGDLE
jgi:acetyl esterase/lipase